MITLLQLLVLVYILYKVFPIFKRLFSTGTMVSEQVLSKTKALIKDHKVFVASKTYCPYCSQTKKLLESLNANAFVVELDTEPDGSDIQAALAELTGQRTVPNVFINGEHVGGNSDLQALNSQGKLKTLLKN
ncbi:BA75_04467T0 [Komagataella pastoris]|uniref:BA75_04467T0 n=1 Tax=Komagataella pastoris TaxID=4922 RepID=A0A1B2JIT2_PICPA|nr:BA75_04467T0 [Komagataella pastoris]